LLMSCYIIGLFNATTNQSVSFEAGRYIGTNTV
jgi:hypothetical protein